MKLDSLFEKPEGFIGKKEMEPVWPGLENPKKFWRLQEKTICVARARENERFWRRQEDDVGVTRAREN